MSDHIPHEPLRFLRDDIVAAGNSIQRVRAWVLGVIVAILFGPLVLWCFGGFIFDGAAWHVENKLEGVLQSIQILAPFAMIYFLFGVMVAVPIAAVYRRSRRSSLLRRLHGVPDAELAAVLFPLRNGQHGDTRKLAASLIRDLRVTDTELVPSEPTPGSGTEPTPVELRRG